MAKDLINIAILGSTGSIGTQALEIIKFFPEKFNVLALANNSNPEIIEQIELFKPKYVSTKSKINTDSLSVNIATIDEICSNKEIDLIVAGISGIESASSIFTSVQHGKDILLASKEAIVIAGEIIINESKKSGSKILPIDSEPSAIWQCINGEVSSPKKIIITASGGAFRDSGWSDLSNVTPQQALNHPTWKMGNKITIDSATLMNKAFEVIESKILFDMDYKNIDVSIHKQSIVHSMVQFDDGVIKAQLGDTNMGNPIQYALFYPERIKNSNLGDINGADLGNLTFEKLHPGKYPCFDTALHYAKKGGSYLSILCGADEAAVQLFLEGKIKYTDIYIIIYEALKEHKKMANPNFHDLIGLARETYSKIISKYKN
tara:strand:+ start:30201 stop:31328 length:1128 start_codon:yes stop_codon:yes gene_type:complete